MGVGRESVTKMPVGSYVVDTRTGRFGVVMGHEGPYVQLRPYGGGREWDAAPDAVREAAPAERPTVTAPPPATPASAPRADGESGGHRSPGSASPVPRTDPRA
ncbi:MULTISPECIES: hypothetical protein [unclassified Streptomyces]|uniref:hypothetical protein n=2 Tax=unclassified Streptomyces TaxID=2593676 RepID=UPI002010D3C5|nr:MULTISPECIES: hypothetical protein [unclassified Streptomyces]